MEDHTSWPQRAYPLLAASRLALLTARNHHPDPLHAYPLPLSKTNSSPRGLNTPSSKPPWITTPPPTSQRTQPAHVPSTSVGPQATSRQLRQYHRPRHHPHPAQPQRRRKANVISEPARAVTLSNKQKRTLSTVQKIDAERQAKRHCVITDVAEVFGVSPSTLYKKSKLMPTERVLLDSSSGRERKQQLRDKEEALIVETGIEFQRHYKFLDKNCIVELTKTQGHSQ